MQQLIETFNKLLQDLIESSTMPVLLIVDGLDANRTGNGLGLVQLVVQFTSRLQEICTSATRPNCATFKAILTHKGYATKLHEFVESSSVVDLTDHAPSTSLLREDLALSISM